MRNKILVGAGVSACLAAWGAKDPVVMTVDGIDVPRSEFEYLYQKNIRQQLSPQPLDEYAEMFAVYKMKVADAKAAGLDTLETFRKEMLQYKRELAEPYLTDSVMIEKLVKEFAARTAEEVHASHIMLLKSRSAEKNRKQRARLDSIRARILAGEDFGKMAAEYSEDPSVKTNGGKLGYIVAGRYPYDFETAVYTLPEGKVSEIVETPAGYHLIMAGPRRKAKGKVEVSHIMVMSRPTDSEESRKQAKERIDSIYGVVKADPSKFADLARRLSQDPGSARQGGRLPAFGTGEMVPEFEEMSFSLSDGEIGHPVKSMYGWHVILRHSSAAGADENLVRSDVMRRLSNPQDGRARMMKKQLTERLALKHKARLDEKVLQTVVDAAKVNGIDSAFHTRCASAPLAEMTIAVVGGKKLPVADFMKGASSLTDIPADMAELIIRNAADSYFSQKLVEAEEDWLYANEPDYRNLLNEYHDGTLLYEVSLDKVWNRASADTEGLKEYFENHRADYTWTHPRVKGLLVQAADDSVAAAVRERMLALPADSVVSVTRREFAGKVKIEKVLAAKGTNPMVDNLYYNGPEVAPSSASFTSYFLYEPREISAPEEVADVKAQVVSDYQNELEKKWVDELKRKYPVKINRKQLGKVK